MAPVSRGGEETADEAGESTRPTGTLIGYTVDALALFAKSALKATVYVRQQAVASPLKNREFSVLLRYRPVAKRLPGGFPLNSLFKALLETYLVDLAGELRLERAIPLIVNKLHILGDVLKMSEAHRRRDTLVPGTVPWKANEDEQVRTLTPEGTSRRMGRNLLAVYTQRERLGVPDEWRE